jgi:Ca2+-binding EF-hand superfamily protein
MGNKYGKSGSKVGKPAKLSAKDEEFLPKRTGLSKAQVQKFYHQFNEDNPDGLLDRNEFNKLYQSLHTVPVKDLDEIQETVFKAFESDKITFREFMLAFSMATFHSEEDIKTQLEYVFMTYDTDASGYLDLNETKELALTGWNLMRPLTLRKTNFEDIDDLAAKYFEKLDSNTDGKVSIGMCFNKI